MAINESPRKVSALTRSLPVLLLVVLGMSWGGHFSLLKIASESGLPFIGIITLTTFGVVAGMTVIAAVRRRWPLIGARHVRFYLVCAVLGYLVEFPLSLIVADEIPAGLLAIIASTSPIFTSLIAIAARVEHVSPRRMGAVFVGLVAAVVVIVPGTALPQPSLIFWVLLAFCIPVIYAVYHNYVAFDWPEGSDSWQVALGESFCAAVIVSAIYAASDSSITEFGPAAPGAWTIAAMAILAIIEIYLYFEIVRLAGAVFVSLASFISIIRRSALGDVHFRRTAQRLDLGQRRAAQPVALPRPVNRKRMHSPPRRGKTSHRHHALTATGHNSPFRSRRTSVGGKSRYSSGWPVRLIQRTSKPKAVAPATSHRFEDWKLTSPGLMPYFSVTIA